MKKLIDGVGRYQQRNGEEVIISAFFKGDFPASNIDRNWRLDGRSSSYGISPYDITKKIWPDVNS